MLRAFQATVVAACLFAVTLVGARLSLKKLGLLYLGNIAEMDDRNGVVLVKDPDTSATFAFHSFQDNPVTLNNTSYHVGAVHKDFFELIDASNKTFTVLFGASKFHAPTKKKKKRVVKKVVEYGGEYREEGFERNKGKILISEEYRQKLIGTDLSKILMQAAAEPALDAQQNIRGFQLWDIEKGSIYEKSGLQDGDIIKEINGTALDSIAGSISLLKSLKGADQIEVLLERGGNEFPVTISVR